MNMSVDDITEGKYLLSVLRCFIVWLVMFKEPICGNVGWRVFIWASSLHPTSSWCPLRREKLFVLVLYFPGLVGSNSRRKCWTRSRVRLGTRPVSSFMMNVSYLHGVQKFLKMMGKESEALFLEVSASPMKCRRNLVLLHCVRGVMSFSVVIFSDLPIMVENAGVG